MKLLLKLFLAPPILLIWLWSLGAFYFLSGGGNSGIAPFAALGFVAITALSLWRYRSRGLWWVPIGFAIALAWFFSVQPSNDREWLPEYGRVPSAVFDGDKVTIRNIRNFKYRSADDFDVEYYDKTFDLAKLDTVVLVPARRAPHKLGKKSAPGEMRASMLEIAVHDIDGLEVDRRELEREGPSYTVDTMKELKNERPGARARQN